MISEITPQRIIQEQFVGLSTDEKPTNVLNGSVFFEMDTGDVYIYDAAHGAWLSITGGSSAPVPIGPPEPIIAS